MGSSGRSNRLDPSNPEVIKDAVAYLSQRLGLPQGTTREELYAYMQAAPDDCPEGHLSLRELHQVLSEAADAERNQGKLPNEDSVDSLMESIGLPPEATLDFWGVMLNTLPPEELSELVPMPPATAEELEAIRRETPAEQEEAANELFKEALNRLFPRQSSRKKE